MAQLPNAMDLDIEDGQKEEEEENGGDAVGDGDGIEEEEIDDVLSNLVKVECEYLLPFLCDIFDLIFERRKEIEMDNLLEYFVGLYKVPKFTVISDDEEDNPVGGPGGNTEKEDSAAESQKGHVSRNASNMSELSHSELANVTFVNQNDVDDNNTV